MKKLIFTNKLRAAFIPLLALAGATLVPPANAYAEQTKSIISVTGTGSATSVPDTAMITLGVKRQAKTARKALDQNNKAMAAVIAALKSSGIDGKDLQTSGFNIRPHFNYPKQSSIGKKGRPKITGYTVSNRLDVRIRDLAKLGEILDKSVTLGVNSGGNIRFITKNPDKFLSLAREKAMADAIAKAKVLTRAAGIALGPVTHISENSQRPQPRPMRQMAIAGKIASNAVPVAAGENSYHVNVQVNWEIKQ